MTPRCRRTSAAAAPSSPQTLSVRVLSRTWQMLLKGIPEVQSSQAGRSAPAEMVLIRLAHAADLPTLDEALRSLEGRLGRLGASSPQGRSPVPAAGSGAGSALPAQALHAPAVRAVVRRCGWSRPTRRLPPRLAAVRSAGAADGARAGCRHPLAGRHRRACRRPARHGLQGAGQALRPSGAHRARPHRHQPDRRCARKRCSRLDRQSARLDRPATGWCRCRAKTGGQTLAEDGIEPSARPPSSMPAAIRRGRDPGALSRSPRSSTCAFPTRRKPRLPTTICRSSRAGAD